MGNFEHGVWYCHYTVFPDGQHQAGNVAQWDQGSAGFVDEDGEPVSMVAEYLPCYCKAI